MNKPAPLKDQCRGCYAPLNTCGIYCSTCHFRSKFGWKMLRLRQWIYFTFQF